MKSDFKDLITKSIVLVGFGFLVVACLMLQDTNLAQEQIVFHFRNSIPIISVAFTVLFIFTFIKISKDQIEKVKLETKYEQQVKDYNILVKLEQNKALSKMKYINQLGDLPELALYLIEKTITITEEFKTELEIIISGSLGSLKSINSEDLKQTIELMLKPITEMYQVTEVKKRRDINLFIREHDNRIEFKIMHDYNCNLIQTEMTEWKIKKLLNKYGVNITSVTEREKDYNDNDILALILTVELPKEIKTRKII